eukprot:2807514-Amphidinium_carterae.2
MESAMQQQRYLTCTDTTKPATIWILSVDEAAQIGPAKSNDNSDVMLWHILQSDHDTESGRDPLQMEQRGKAMIYRPPRMTSTVKDQGLGWPRRQCIRRLGVPSTLRS